MNTYRSNPNAWRAEPSSTGGLAEIWSGFTHFARRQPELVVAGALIGGALLGFWVKGAPVPSFDHSPTQQRRPVRRAAGPERMPSTRLGATEDQMSDNFPTPSAHALETGSGGTTGAIYDLDPDSLTSG